MRASRIAVVVLMGLGLVACDRGDRARRGPAAREVGRDAYRASQEAKQEARKAGRELRDASKEFRQGWDEAKHTTRDHPDRTERTDRDR